MPTRLVPVLAAAALLTGCSSSSSQSSPVQPGPQDSPSALVLVADVAPGAHWENLAQDFIKLHGVVATSGGARTFQVSLASWSTMRDYMKVRAGMNAVPGLTHVEERTSTGVVLATGR